MQDIPDNSGQRRGGLEYKWIALSNTTLSIMLAMKRVNLRSGPVATTSNLRAGFQPALFFTVPGIIDK
jgi:hypothetical protein